MQTITWDGEQKRHSQDWPQNTNCLLTNGPNIHAVLPVFIKSRQEQACLILKNRRSSRNTNFNQPIDPTDWAFPVMFSFAPWGPMEGTDCQWDHILYLLPRNTEIYVSPGNKGIQPITFWNIWDTSYDHSIPQLRSWDQVGNLRLNEVKFGIYMSWHCQGPP